MLSHCSNLLNSHQTKTTWRQFHYEEVRQHLRVNRVVIANLIDRYRNNNYYQAGEQEELDTFNIVWCLFGLLDIKLHRYHQLI